jgi:hypothetical protein
VKSFLGLLKKRLYGYFFHQVPPLNLCLGERL